MIRETTNIEIDQNFDNVCYNKHDGNGIPYSKYPGCGYFNNDFIFKEKNMAERSNSEYVCDYTSDNDTGTRIRFNYNNITDATENKSSSFLTFDQIDAPIETFKVHDEMCTLQLNFDFEESFKQYDDTNNFLLSNLPNKRVEESKSPFNIQSNSSRLGS